MGPFKAPDDEDSELRAECVALDAANFQLREELAVMTEEESKASDMLVIERDDLQERLGVLEARIHGAFELYAGMDGFALQTVGERYLYSVIRCMAEELKP